MSSRRPPRAPGGSRGPFSPSPGGDSDDSPAQTNLGLLLQQALQRQAQTQAAPVDEAPEKEEALERRETQFCADCWNAKTFKDDSGRQMARCARDLWVKPACTYQDLNNNKVRRWYADCPEYDDSE